MTELLYPIDASVADPAKTAFELPKTGEVVTYG